MSSTYELQLEIVAPAESQLEAAENDVELVYSAHGPTHFLTIWQEAATPLSAAMIAVAHLRKSGIKVQRAVEDLVSRQDIADRLSVSRQAVGNWIRGERRGSEGEEFPSPYNLVGGGVWLWKDVNDWARGIAATDNEVEHLAAIDYMLINHWIYHDDLGVLNPSFMKEIQDPDAASQATDGIQFHSL
ncbi:hypothetical protein GCM10009715_22690 [Paeniglutamicibacter psychrophenolicus]|uniref:DNA-binding transcriptional regulator YiaG n=1 Tax=Paeniglutamicibacter psychrophenolicus TaxID=257454 RepID=A0ABS4WHM2_9MICC|nr:hypothetical protein [Paeniglutamicibacter psychrophenolicus]MBP2375704.1 DNA-binding transcriptional regulator YiaG [Paeniglutamicibacter psychrophenolicus]